jgi:acyl-CoA synthetase (NDP forming)
VACAQALLNDPGYAALVVMAPTITPGVTPRNVAMFSRLAEAADKPVCMAWMSEWREGPGAREAEMDPRVALFHATDRVFRTLRLWFDREDLLAAAPTSGAAKPDAGRMAETRRILHSAGPRLSERDAKGLLGLYGVAFVQDRVVQTADDAVAAAGSTGYPVVLKVESPDIAHKTEAGVVRLGLRDAAAVRAAFEAVMWAAKRVEPPARIAGVLVQPMLDAGVEIVVGSQLDPTFGPLVVVGLGGVMVELLRDATTELAPVNHAQARMMLGRLQGFPLLTGFRGSAPVDLDKLCEVIVRVSQAAAELADVVAEIDVNPVICGPGRAIAVDALVVRRSVD